MNQDDRGVVHGSPKCASRRQRLRAILSRAAGTVNSFSGCGGDKTAWRAVAAPCEKAAELRSFVDFQHRQAGIGAVTIQALSIQLFLDAVGGNDHRVDGQLRQPVRRQDGDAVDGGVFADGFVEQRDDSMVFIFGYFCNTVYPFLASTIS
ncbi:MAG TPA: hypothetical protein PK961_05095 [bacterium]|nr:hypothetical protein [bacterium]